MHTVRRFETVPLAVVLNSVVLDPETKTVTMAPAKVAQHSRSTEDSLRAFDPTPRRQRTRVGRRRTLR